MSWQNKLAPNPSLGRVLLSFSLWRTPDLTLSLLGPQAANHIMMV